MRGIFHLRHLRTAAGFLLTVLLCLLVVAPFASASFAGAQEKPERRTIPVTVMDKSGRGIGGLHAENFRVKVAGKPVTVLTAKLPAKPLRIAILLDTRSSMSNGVSAFSVSSLAAAAVRDAVALLARDYPIALFGFNKGVTQYTEFTQDLAQLSAGFARMTSPDSPEEASKTKMNTYGSVLEVSRLIDDGDLGSVIYVVTNGRHLQDRKKRKKIEQELVRRGIRVYSNCIDLRHMLSPLPNITSISVTSCETLAQASGGSYETVYFKTPRIRKRVEMVVLANGRRLFSKMVYIYRVEIELPKGLKKPQKWKLEVVDERGKKIKGLKVIYPRLLVPLETPAGK